MLIVLEQLGLESDAVDEQPCPPAPQAPPEKSVALHTKSWTVLVEPVKLSVSDRIGRPRYDLAPGIAGELLVKH